MHLWLWKFKENFHFSFYRAETSTLIPTKSNFAHLGSADILLSCVEILGRTTYDSLLRESSKPVHFLEDLV